MSRSRTRGWFSRAMAACTSAAVLLSAFAPGTAALAAEVHLPAPEVRVGDNGVGGVSGVQSLSLTAPLNAPALAPLGGPVSAAPSAPTLAAPAALELGGHARPTAVPAQTVLVPAAPTVMTQAPALSATPAAAAAGGPAAKLGQWLSGLLKRTPSAAPAVAPAADDGAPAVDESRGDDGVAKENADAEFSKLTGESPVERPALDESAVAAPAASAALVPALTVPGRLAGLDAAESRARASAKGRAEHARLIRASVDLRGGGARWTFAYHAPAKKQIVTVGPKGVESRPFRGAERPPMIAAEDLARVDLDRDLAALAEANPGFKPVRADVVPRATGGFAVNFFDATGASAKAPAAPAPVVVPSPAAPSPVEAATAPEASLPSAWEKMPSEAREADSAALVKAKAEAQERARRIAPDARLVGVAINLEDPRSHWIFTFRSDKRREEITVWTKRIQVKRLGFRPTKAPTLRDGHLGAMGSLERAVAAVEKAAPAFRPVRVEVDPAWNGPASYRFLDADGRAVTVGADGAARLPAAALPIDLSAKNPPSFANLPEDARGADGKSLLALKADAEARARRISPDARLVRVAINLDEPNAHWIFVFRSDKSRAELTVWTKRIQRKRLPPRARPAATLDDAALGSVAPVAAAYAALKKAKPGLKPTRAELTAAAGVPTWAFLDGRGRGTEVRAAPAAAPVPVPDPIPEERGPPQTPPTPDQSAPPATPPADTTPAPAPPAQPPLPTKYLYEDFLGFRTVRGVVRDEKLGRLPADASVDRIVEQIAGQFGFTRDEVTALGKKYRLDENSTRAAWLAVYDRMQAANRDQFKRLDSKKYSGWSSFRELANKTYPEGWKGTLLRVSELHKHFLGFAVRFPYHLFDMFLFGYFRQASAFEFRHSREDFFVFNKDKGLARKWLEASMREQAFRGEGVMGGLRARPWFRGVERWFVVPVAKPLATFMVRRLTLAVLSAVAMGLLGAFAPVLPLSFALTSIPVLGPAIVWALNGIPVAAAAIPFVGHFLAPVVSAAVGALAKDLILGPLLNTMILSSLLTYPATVRERLAEEKDKHPSQALTGREIVSAVGGALISWSFWKANLKSFVGLSTVGAEIAGIMTYAGQIDAGIDPTVQHFTGHKLGLFEKIGAAVERPKGDSPIPFGGAITWGSTLLYKLQDATGFHISESVMTLALGLKSAAGHHDAADAAHPTAAAVVHAAQTRDGWTAPFDADLWKKSPAEVTARIKDLASHAGALDAEIAAVKEHMTALNARLGDKQAALAILQKQSKPVSPEELARYDALLKELEAKRDEGYVRGKLSERHDLKNPAAGDELKRLQRLQDQYRKSLPPPPPDHSGYWDQLASQEAAYRALSTRLKDLAEGRNAPTLRQGGSTPTDPALVAQIEKVVGAIEQERLEIQTEMTQRDATGNLIRAANQIRNHALHERRDGSDMMKFHTDFAKLATVMDLALSLNEIAAAQAAIKQMLNLLEQKRAAILASQQQNNSNQAGAAANQAQVNQWKQDAQNAINGDKSSIQSLTDDETEASMASARASGFQQNISALIASINAMDKQGSPDALTQYQKDLDMLAQVAQWRQNGNPNDPSQFSVKQFQDDLTEVNSDLQQAQDGLNQIKGVPIEFAGVLVVAVPGPKVTVTNPTQAQMLQVLNDRQAYWQAKLATYQGNLNSVNQLMDPNHAVVDEFGLSHGYNASLNNMSTLHQGNPAAGSKADAQVELKQLDAIASELNAVTGSQIPMLSGLSLTDLQTAIKNYGDALKAVKFPGGTVTPQIHQAQMDLILAAQITPMAARAIVNWSVDQATIDTFDKAKAPGGALTVAQSGLTTVVAMINSILSDVQADRAFVQNGTGGGQALIDRKTALLQNTIIPGLTQAQSMLGTLVTYEQGSITDVQGNGSQYYKLFSSEQTLMQQTQDLYNKTLPWALASFGGSSTDIPGSLASIAAWKASLQKYIDGYTDATGQHEGITQYQKDMVDRQCQSGCTRTEQLYGETQPYSLPMKISQYGAEEAQRAQEINAQDAQINEILGKIETLTAGKYHLSQYMLPTGVSADPASVAKVQAVVDANLIPNLGTVLKQIGNDAQAASNGTSLTINTGGNGTVPVGTQPSPTIGTEQQIALLALDAGKRLVPSSLTTPQSAAGAYAVARFLYSDAVVKAATDGLNNQVPQAVAFLQQASKALNDAITSTNVDVAFVNSNGTSETPDALFARKIATFNELDAFLKQGIAFYGLKQTWDSSSSGTIDKIATYYNSLNTIYTDGAQVNNNEITAVNTMEKALQDTYNNLDQTKAKVTSWMSQLNPKEQSALRRVSDDVSAIQDKTRAVLEANIQWHDLQDQLKRSQQIISAHLTTVDDDQRALADLLGKDGVQDGLPPDLVRRIEALRVGKNAWSMGDPNSTQAIVVKKSQYGAFLDTVLGMLTQGSSQLAHQDLGAIKGDLLAHPEGLSSFIPGSTVMDFGDTADGFYLVYQSKFSVPNGLETGSWVTLGNVAQLWGNNISVSGYAFNSPPSSGGQNAPYGDKGVEVQVESLQGRSEVNYLNVDMHRFGFDIPADNTVGNNIGESRLMIFDDYAMMLLGDKLYVGLAGYGDMALNQPMDHPYYYGGNLKTSLKLTEVMSLNASQQELFAKDPRKFLENVNLDFTGYDPTLNQTFPVAAQGDNKSFSRTQIGPSFDINRLMNPNGGGDTFTVDLFYAKTSGTDDINQQSIGTTVLKGFSIKNDEGKTWLRIDNRLNGELGQQANTLGDRLSFTLPDQGITVSGEGQIIGNQTTHYASIVKKTGDNTSISLGYGSQYVGQPDRLSLQLNTSFTLGQLWQAVADNSHKGLEGGETLKQFNDDMSEFFGGKNPEKASRTVQELRRVYEQDVARKLISQDIGGLTKDIQDLRKAGAFMDNTRVRGMVGFTSNAVSNDTAELAVGGGFTVGTYTEMSLTKTQKQLIADRSASLYREGLRLQDRLLTITKDWQTAVVDLAQAQWDVKLARYEAMNSPTNANPRADADNPNSLPSNQGPLRAEAQVRLAQAQARLDQALVNYNAMTGRDPSAPSPFADMNQKELTDLLTEIRGVITAPDRYAQILGQLDQKEIEARLGKNPFNLVDWIPWVDKLSIGFGVQYQDMMANQALTAGIGVRLPIYDPHSKAADKAFVLESQASAQEIQEVYQSRLLAVSGERGRARAWQASADAVGVQGVDAANRLANAIRQYRNGLIDADALRSAFAAWRWYAHASLETQSQASLAAAQEAVDKPMLPDDSKLPSGPATISSIDDAYRIATNNSHSLAEIAARSQAADEMARAEDHRIQKFWLDLSVGTGLTARGLGWIPSIGITGIPVTPIFGFELKPEELRELQVKQHENQQAYYDALKTRVEAGLAVQFYQGVVAYRTADERVRLYDESVLPRMSRGAPGSDDARRYDEARLGREQAAFARDQARALLNLLLGRRTEAPLDLQMSEQDALSALSRLLADKQVVANERRILDARVGTARAVEEMVDKNLKVDVLQLEPVSLVVRSLGRLIGALGDSPVYDADNASAARVETLNAERAREAYDGRRAEQVNLLRTQLTAARSELAAVNGASDPDAMLKQNELAGRIYMLRAGLLGIGENPDAAPTNASSGALPSSWAEAKRRLASAEQGISAVPADGVPDIPSPAMQTPRSGAYLRYYYAKQTLGHAPIDKSFLEGWIEIRLKDPNTPPEVLLALSKLRDDKAAQEYGVQMIGAAAKADVLASRFEADAALKRWADRNSASAGTDFRRDLDARLTAERDEIVSLLGLDPKTTVADLLRLVPEDEASSGGLSALADETIRKVRERELPGIRAALFPDGLAVSNDDLMSQLKANTIAEQMSYKGFTPVAAAGVFRGTPVTSAFLEAPDPRDIEKALENVMSDALRKQLESDGRMHDLALHMNQLMTQVADGAKQLEAERREVEAAESDLKARAALAHGAGDPSLIAAQRRLVDAWGALAQTMVETKTAFIDLVTELDAMGRGSAGTLRPFREKPTYEPRPLRQDATMELLDFWTERMSDPHFVDESDRLLAEAGAAVPQALRDRIRDDARLYQNAVVNDEAVRDNAFSPTERVDLLTRNDLQGKRQILRADLAEALRGFGALDARSGPAFDLMTYFRRAATEAADAGKIDRDQKREVSARLRETFWSATAPSPAAEAAFRRLEGLEADLDAKREILLSEYLTDAGGDPAKFVIKDLTLDDYLKAQKKYDDEIAADLESPAFKNDTGMARVLDGLHGVSDSLGRSVDRARFGRGMDALNALIMLETTRLNAARWGGRPPLEIDAIAESLQNLRDMQKRWTDAKSTDGPEPVYAVTRVENGRRTWTVDAWLTQADFEARLKLPANAEGAIVARPDGTFVIPAMKDANGVARSYEVVGGVDTAEALRAGADKKLVDNTVNADLSKLMGDPAVAFVSVDAPGKSRGWSYDDVFSAERPGADAKSLYAQGRLFFFRAADGRALNPLAALSLPPDQVAIRYYAGEGAVGRDRFPTLTALETSDAAKDFRRFEITPTGVREMIAHDRDSSASELRRGWIEVKLNSFGFARDENGRMVQLFRTQDDFDAEWKAFRNAERDLADAKRVDDEKAAAVDARKAELDAAKAGFDAAAAALRAAGGTPNAKAAADAAQAAAEAEMKQSPNADAPQRADFQRAIRGETSSSGTAAQKAFDKASKAYAKAGDAYKLAQAEAVNAAKARRDAQDMLDHSRNWTLYRTSDLDLGLDEGNGVVSASAPGAYGRKDALNARVGDAGTPVAHLTGPLSAVVLDDKGRIVKSYGDDASVDAAADQWKLVSFTPDGDINANLGDGRVATKVRISHYEENDGGVARPVLLSERYLIDRLDESKSRLGTAKHWAIMPYNWGNIVLEIPRGVVSAPIELATGRDPNSSHYLGRAMMYKTEGGETDHHGFFRSALGWIDVLNLLPDQVDRYYDPSQFPDAAFVKGGKLKPGQILADRSPRSAKRGADGLEPDRDIKYGVVSMTRQVREAAEDLDAARERTLSRFNGGYEETTLETMRGRGHQAYDARGNPVWVSDYLESTVVGRSGDEVVAGRRTSYIDDRVSRDPVLGANLNSIGGGDAVESATPNGLFVDRVERRTRIDPGAAGYDARAAALQGYDKTQADRYDAARIAADGAALSAQRASADRDAALAQADRDRVASEEARLWKEWHDLAERIGAQRALERRMDALRAEISDLKARLAWWKNYEARLEAAKRGEGPVVPGGPDNPPTNPGGPNSPFGAFWALILALFALGSLLSAAWHARRDALLRRPRAS